MPRFFVAAIVLSCAAFCARLTDVRAGTAVRLDVPGLVDHAELVVEARVSSTRAVLAADGRIETEVSLQVTHSFLGDPLVAQVVRVPGGVLPASQGGRGLALPGMPSLTAGEEVILFLTAAGSSGVRMPVGLAQGKFRIVRDALGARFAVQSLGSLSLVDAQGTPAPVVAGVLELDALAAQIEAAVRAKLARSARHEAAGKGN